MLESEAMALSVSAVPSYKNRDAALALAGSALAVLQDAGRYAAQLGDKGVAQVRRAWLEREERLGALEEKRMHILLRGEKGYPPLLEQIEQPPHLLYVWGSTDLTDPFPVAIVGTRRASAYGVTHSRMMARELARAGVCVVSGLALGVDASAHEGALDAGGRTLAVLGSALDKFYPEENRALMERILASGGKRRQRISAGNRADEIQLFAAQPHHCGHRAGDAGYGSTAQERCVPNGAMRIGGGARGIRPAGQRGQPRLSASASADCGRRTAGDKREGHPFRLGH
ncbi:MAG: DNA-processing protein DprA [Christensenellales bacterium]